MMDLLIGCPNCGGEMKFEFQEAYYQCATDGRILDQAPPPLEPEGIPSEDWECDETERICVYLCLQCGIVADFYGL